MNLTIATTGARTFSLVRRHYLMALAAATLAITAVVGAAVLTASDGAATARPAGASTAGALKSVRGYYTPVTETMTFFLVDSEEARESLLTTLSSELMAGARPVWPYRIFVAGPPAEEQSARETIAEIAPWYAQDGGSYQVVDGRAAPAPAAAASHAANADRPVTFYLVGSEDQRQAVLRSFDDAFPGQDQAFFVLVTGTPEEELDAKAKINALASATPGLGVAIQTIDLR